MAISTTGNSYVSWGAIFAGAALACALSVVMLQFGSAIGLSATDITDGDRMVSPARMFGIAFWILWIQLLASLIGGYVTGRLRTPVQGASEQESEVRDGLHGLLAWATASLAVVVAGAAVAAIGALAPEAVEPAVRQTPELIANQKAVSVIVAFSAAATSLVSAVASWCAATKGGDHRDNETDVRGYFSFKTR